VVITPAINVLYEYLEKLCILFLDTFCFRTTFLFIDFGVCFAWIYVCVRSLFIRF